MIDNMESRIWTDHGHQFSEQVARAFAKSWIAFERLNAIQFDAPWKRQPRPTGKA